MHKTSIYTLVNGNIEELAHWKQPKLQKVILPASHWLCVKVLLNNDHSKSTKCQTKIGLDRQAGQIYTQRIAKYDTIWQ